ncbi:MAG: phage tail spike protein [Sporomusa sp.]
MIQIYSKGNTNYDQNGDIVLFPTECKLNAVLKGQWELTLEHPKDDEGRWQYIKEEAVICADTFIGKKQLFPIYSIERDGNTIIARAYPIFFNSKNDVYFIDKRPTNKTAQETLDILMENTVYSGTTNMSSVSTAYYIKQNLIGALNGDIDQSFVNRWGGEPIFDNLKVIVNERAGGDYGVEIRYGKNLESINETVDMSSIGTRLVPVAFNGYMLDGDAPWVDSPLINEYSRIYYQEVKFEKIKLAADVTEDDDDAEIYDTIDELRVALKKAAEAQFDEGIDKPSVTLEISMIDLASMVEYKDYKILETVSLGDTVHCVHSELNIDTKARVVEMTWDCIKQVADNLVIGDPNYNYFDNVSSAANAVNEVINVSNKTVTGERIAGVIDMMATQLRCQRSIAKKQEVRAIMFEDTDPASELYGAMCLGTQGFQIAKERTTDDKDWNWRTFGTAKGFMADLIIAGVMYSLNYAEGSQGIKIDLDRGEILSPNFNVDASGNVSLTGTIESSSAKITGGAINIATSGSGEINTIRLRNSSPDIVTRMFNAGFNTSWANSYLGNVYLDLYATYLWMGTFSGTVDSPGTKSVNIYAYADSRMGCVSLNQTSDRKLKKDIETIPDDSAKDFITGLNPVSYRFKEGDSGIHYGFVAQEVQEIIDKEYAVVTEEKEEKGVTMPMSIAYTELIAPMVRLLQQHEERIEELERRLKEYESA